MPNLTATTFAPPTDPSRLPECLRSIVEFSVTESDLRRDAPKQLLAAFRDSGALRLLTPREYGGSETPLTTTLRVYEDLARIDAAAGLLVWNANFGFIGALLSESGAQRIWHRTPEPYFANSAMFGTAEIASGGFRVSGRFRMVAGINSADWLIAAAIITENGRPRLVKGLPDIRLVAVHVEDISIDDTWNVSALRGTGSNDATVDNVFVPADLVTPELDGAARIDRPLYRMSVPTLVFPGCTAVALGVAQSAVDEMVALANRKAPGTGALLAEDDHAQYTIAKADVAISAARLLLYTAVEELESCAERKAQPTIEQRASLRAAMTHAAEVSREALVAMYELAGPSAMYRFNPLERKIRDGMAILQHANHTREWLQAAGRVRLGREPAKLLF